MNLRIGQRVVCIDDFFKGKLAYFTPNGDLVTLKTPIKNLVYVIRDLEDHGKNGVGCMLEEIVNPIMDSPIDGIGEPTFHPRRFRPVKETNIDVFTAMLAPTPKQKVDA